MRNRDRELTLRSFAELYRPEDADDMVRRMPSEKTDPEGSLFDEYFSMIQTVVASGADESLSPKEKTELNAKMKLIALKYGYPTKVLIDVEGTNDKDSQ